MHPSLLTSISPFPTDIHFLPYSIDMRPDPRLYGDFIAWADHPIRRVMAPGRGVPSERCHIVSPRT